MYLDKAEVDACIERLMRTCEDADVIAMCHRAKDEIKGVENEGIKHFIKEKCWIVKMFMNAMCSRKHVPLFVVDFVYILLVNELFAYEDAKEIVCAIGENSWCEASKMKILQMSYYLMRYDEFGGDVALSLLKSLLAMVDDKSRQVQTAARSIAMHLVDFVFARMHSMPARKVQSEGDMSINERVCDAENVDGVDYSKSEQLPCIEMCRTVQAVNDGMCFLKHLLACISCSKEMCYFVVDALCMITLRDGLFVHDIVKNVYLNDVMDSLVRLVSKRCSSKGGIYKVIEALAERNGEMFEKSIQVFFCEVEKAYDGFDELEREMFLEFFGRMSVYLARINAIAVRRVFFRILGDMSVDEMGSRDVIASIKGSLQVQQAIQAELNGTRYNPCAKVFFDKFSAQLLSKLMDTGRVHDDVKDLLCAAVDFYAGFGDKERLEKFLSVGMRLGFCKEMMQCAIENRKGVQESWKVVIDEGKECVGLVVDAIGHFDAEEMFYVLKGVSMIHDGDNAENAWSGKEKIDFLHSVFNVMKPVIVEPLNVRMFEMILNGVIEESKEDGMYATRIFCLIVVDYVSDVEILSAEIEGVVFGMMERMLKRSADAEKKEVLEVLLKVLRLVTPEAGWDVIVECVRYGCVPELYSSVYLLIQWMVGGFSHLLSGRHFEVIVECLWMMCRSVGEDEGIRLMYVLRDVGECLSGMNRMESKGREAWTKYVEMLREELSDGRVIMRDTAVRYLLELMMNAAWMNDADGIWSEAVIGICEVFEKGRQLIAESGSDELNTVCLMLRESGGCVEMICRHERVSNVFFEVLVDGVCSNNDEVRLLSMERFKMVVKCITDSDECKREVGIGMKICKKDLEVRDSGMRVRIQEIYKSMLRRIPIDCVCNAEPVNVQNDMIYGVNRADYEDRLSGRRAAGMKSLPICLEMVEMLKCFLIREHDLRMLMPYLERFVTSGNRLLQEKVIGMIEMLASGEDFVDARLDVYVSWISAEDVGLSRMLIERIGLLLGRSGERYSEVVVNIARYCGDEGLWEDVVRGVMCGTKGKMSRHRFVSFVNGSKMIFAEACKLMSSAAGDAEPGDDGMMEVRDEVVGKMKRVERIALEFLMFYHGVLVGVKKMYFEQGGVEQQPFDEVTLMDLKEGYGAIFEMIGMDARYRRESVLMRCYGIVFHDIEVVYLEVVERIRHVLDEYNRIEAVYNGFYSMMIQREVYVILGEMARRRDKRLIEEVRRVLVDVLRSKDYRVIEYARRCFEVLFE